MVRPTLIETKQQLRANVAMFAAMIPTISSGVTQTCHAIADGCARAVEWSAFPDGKGGWDAAFTKYAGYNGMTPDLYDRYRKGVISGTDAKRRVEKLGGIAYGVGHGAGLPHNHPAVERVHNICTAMGKTPKRTAKVRVFSDDVRPATMDVLVAAIRAADLDPSELDILFAEVRRENDRAA